MRSIHSMSVRELRDSAFNTGVGPTATEVSAKAFVYLFAGSVRMLIKKRLGRHHESRRAKAALLCVVVHERRRHRMQLILGSKTVSRDDLLTLSFDRQHRAGINGLVVKQHGART